MRIEKLVYGGAGLAREEGRVVLTPFVLPGEEVQVETVRTRKDMVEARLVNVVESSAQRVEAPCPYFGECGGCQYQHTNYENQLALKAEILREVFQRVGKLEAPAFDVISGDPWGYRNRSQFHISDGAIGYQAMGSNKLIDVKECPISSPRINEGLAGLRRMIGQPRFPRFVQSLELFTNGTQIQLNVLTTEGDKHVARGFFDWCEAEIPGVCSGAIEYNAVGYTFRVSHKSFFQVNRFLTDRLVEIALDGLAGEKAIDLYAGVGLFSLPLALKFEQVIAVESGAAAVRDLESNAAKAKKAVKAVRSSADLYLEEVKTAPDVVLLDPPRAGMGKAVVRELKRLKPARIVVVACDPATLARDLAQLLGEGGYAIEKMTLVDLFPQTFHMETVVRLALR